MPMKFGYWRLQGLVQSIRYLLEYTSTSYEEKLYDATEEGQAEWFQKDKKELGLDIPNLPYLITDDLKLTQSLAIVRYIADHNNLSGEGNEKYQVLMVELQAKDLFNALRNLVYGTGDYEQALKGYLEKLAKNLQVVSHYLGDRHWFVGDSIKSCDFVMYSFLDIIRRHAPEVFETFPNLVEFINRFEALPAIASYQQSNRFIKSPYFGPEAHWGGK